jgi:hypothetical protein
MKAMGNQVLDIKPIAKETKIKKDEVAYVEIINLSTSKVTVNKVKRSSTERKCLEVIHLKRGQYPERIENFSN